MWPFRYFLVVRRILGTSLISAHVSDSVQSLTLDCSSYGTSLSIKTCQRRHQSLYNSPLSWLTNHRAPCVQRQFLGHPLEACRRFLMKMYAISHHVIETLKAVNQLSTRIRKVKTPPNWHTDDFGKRNDARLKPPFFSNFLTTRTDDDWIEFEENMSPNLLPSLLLIWFESFREPQTNGIYVWLPVHCRCKV